MCVCVCVHVCALLHSVYVFNLCSFHHTEHKIYLRTLIFSYGGVFLSALTIFTQNTSSIILRQQRKRSEYAVCCVESQSGEQLIVIFTQSAHVGDFDEINHKPRLVALLQQSLLGALEGKKKRKRKRQTNSVQ